MTVKKIKWPKRWDKPPVVALCGTAVLNKKNHYKETNVPKGMGFGRMNPAAETGGLSIKRMEAYQGGR